LSSLLHTHKKNTKDKNNLLKLEESQFYNHLLSMDVKKLDTNLKIELLPCTAPWFGRAIRAWWSAPPEAIPDTTNDIILCLPSEGSYTLPSIVNHACWTFMSPGWKCT
jgi:hypothetical protein